MPHEKGSIFVRFIVDANHEDSKLPLGIMHAVRYLRDDGKLTKRQLQSCDKVFDWLYENLEAPRKSVFKTHPFAVSWFRASAIRHLSWTRRLIPVVVCHGYQVSIMETSQPGKIIYEDRAQIIAEPTVEAKLRRTAWHKWLKRQR